MHSLAEHPSFAEDNDFLHEYKVEVGGLMRQFLRDADLLVDDLLAARGLCVRGGEKAGGGKWGTAVGGKLGGKGAPGAGSPPGGKYGRSSSVPDGQQHLRADGHRGQFQHLRGGSFGHTGPG